MRGDKSPFAVERVEPLDHARNTIGSGPDAAIKLTGDDIPAIAGEVAIRDGKPVLLSTSAKMHVNGKYARDYSLVGTDWVSLGTFRMQIRHPDGKFALRISNLEGEGMKHFSGLKYYPIDNKYRVAAQFTAEPGQKEITVDSSQGGPQQLPYAGKLSFELLGKPYTLDAFIDGDEPDALFVIFRDATSGKETYGVGRYIYVSRGSRTTLDFNKAFNPLCAYGPMFFCPIPPKQNTLPVPIPAGEKPYEVH